MVVLTRPWSSTVKTGSVSDGSLVQVIGRHREWLRVTAAEAPPAAGWIHEFYTRRTVHVVGDPAHWQVHPHADPGLAATRE